MLYAKFGSFIFNPILLFELLTPQRPGFRSPLNHRFITPKLLKLSL